MDTSASGLPQVVEHRPPRRPHRGRPSLDGPTDLHLLRHLADDDEDMAWGYNRLPSNIHRI